MVGFFALRKLIESNKIDDATANQNVKVITYSSTGKRVTRINWFKAMLIKSTPRGAQAL